MFTGFRCLDCRVNTLRVGRDREHEYYSVRDDVWAQTGLDADDGMLCIGCLEQRIGRRLAAADFIDCVLNDLSVTHISRTRRLVSRLTAATSTPVATQGALW